MIDGVSTQPFNDPRIAARLNARYSELTGENHPNFLLQQEKVLDGLLSQEKNLIKNDAYTPMEFSTFRRLKENLKSGQGVEIISGRSEHVLNRFDSIIRNIEQASLEDVSKLLDYFNGPSVMIDGVSVHPFNDPRIAARLNARYSEFTGENHVNFLVQQEKVLDNLLAQETFLKSHGAYSEDDFKTFRNFRENLANRTSYKETISKLTNEDASKELGMQVQNMLQANEITTSEFINQEGQIRQMQQFTQSHQKSSKELKNGILKNRGR